MMGNRMAIRYITIKIPIPSLSWFKTEELVFEPRLNLTDRINDVNRRIARARLGLKDPQPQARPNSVDSENSTEREIKTKELDDIKAKLLGKKK
jgi:hypothetical protein